MPSTPNVPEPRSVPDSTRGAPPPRGSIAFGVQLGLGCISFFAVLGLGVLAATLTESGWVFMAVVLLGFFAVGVAARNMSCGRGILLGILIAMGLCLLSAGICIATFHLDTK